MSDALRTVEGRTPRGPYALGMEVQDGIAVITFDLPGESVNKIGRAVKDEFLAVADRLERDKDIRGAVLISGKPDVFIAGADIEEFLLLETAAQAERLSRDGQMLIDTVAKMRIPLVAAIHGACLGGGLELALACTYRIATDHPKTVLALPEVQLGIIPGAGGTQRLPRKIGLRAALEMILTGKNVRAKKAHKIGLVEELVHPAILRQIAVQRAKELGNGKRPQLRKERGFVDTLLDGNPIGRGVVLRKAREETLRKTKGHYPAPVAALDAVAAGLSGRRSHGYREESRLFGEMAATDVSRQLIYLFFATTALKKDTGVDVPAEPRTVNKLGILGAGFMGSGIASVAVQQGTVVRMKDADHARVAKGFAAVRSVLKERLTKRQITRTELEDTMSLLGGSIDYSGFGNVDLVIEAVFEDLETKHQVLREAEAEIKPEATFASNTSTIPIARIAEGAARPERVLGMHFFSPVHKMPLIEVITTPGTSPEAVATAVAYGKRLGKTVIVVNDGPGFYVNRILFPYINEAGRLLEQGASVEAIDEAMVQFGFPVGPMTLLDEVGMDVGAKAAGVMHQAFGERFAPASAIERLVAGGRYGRKAKKGFFLYGEDGKKGNVDPEVYAVAGAPAERTEIPAVEIQQRCVYAMLNEAIRCLEDGIIRSERDGDVGAVFGIGFPPFRGGPFRYIDSIGPVALVSQLEDLNSRFPGRFEPTEGLLRRSRR